MSSALSLLRRLVIIGQHVYSESQRWPDSREYRSLIHAELCFEAEGELAPVWIIASCVTDRQSNAAVDIRLEVRQTIYHNHRPKTSRHHLCQADTCCTTASAKDVTSNPRQLHGQIPT